MRVITSKDISSSLQQNDSSLFTLANSSEDLAANILPSLAYFHDARFTQSGDDLILTLPDGTNHVVADYFINDVPPTLTGLFNNIQYALNPNLVQTFLEKPMLVAQTTATDAPPVGTIGTINGDVVAVGAGGSRRSLEVGSILNQGEVLETAQDSSVKVIMLDQTLFSLGANSRMAVNDLNYDASSNSGNSSYSILKGSFLFVSGLIAKNNPSDMEVSTPVGIIGIRGTIVSGQISGDTTDENLFQFSVIDGAIEFITEDGSVYNLDNSFESIKQVAGQDEPVTEIATLQDILDRNSQTLQTLSSEETKNMAQDISKSLSEDFSTEIKITIDASAKVVAETEDPVLKSQVEGSSNINNNPATVAVVNATAEEATIATSEPTVVETVVEAITEAEILTTVLETLEAIEEESDDEASVFQVILKPIISLQQDSAVNGDNITNNGTINISNLLNGSTWEYSLDNGQNWTAGTGSSLELTEDGLYSVVAREITSSGVESEASNNISFTLDTTAPSAPSLALETDSGISNDNITNDGTVTVSDLEDGATWEYSIDNGTSWQVKKDGTTFELPDDGTYDVQVKQTDAAGNEAISETAKLTLDASATKPIFAFANDSGTDGDNISNDGTVTVSGLEDGATWQYSTNAGTSWTEGTGTTFELPNDGTYDVQVKQTDAAGNEAISETAKLTLDASATKPTFAFANDSGTDGDNISNDGTVTVSGLEDGATWQYSIDNGTSWTEGTGTTFELPNDGTYDVQVKQTDAAGNEAISETAKLTLDASATKPTFAFANDSGTDGDNISNDGTVTVSGLEDGATWQYSTNAGTSWTEGTGTTFELPKDGTYYVQVKQTDIAGNEAISETATLTLDTAATKPTFAFAKDTGIEGDNISNDGTITVSGLEKGATWHYSTDAGTSWAEGKGTTFELPKDGTYYVQVKQTDAAGNSAVSNTARLTLDTALTIAFTNDTGNDGNDGISNENTIKISNLSEEDGATWQYSTDAGTSWKKGTEITFDLPTQTSQTNKFSKDYTVQVQQIDAVGSVSDITEKKLTFDTLAPDAPVVENTGIISGTNTDTAVIETEVKTFTVSLASEDGITWRYRLNENDDWTIGSGNSFDLPDVTATHNIEVQQLDKTGNASDSSKTTVTYKRIVDFVDNSGISNDTISNTKTLKATFLENNTDSKPWSYSLDGGNTWSSPSNAGSNTFDIDGADGTYSIAIRFEKVDGHETSAVQEITIDNTVVAPTIPDAQSLNPPTFNDNTVSVDGIEDGATWEYSTDSGDNWVVGSKDNTITFDTDGYKSVLLRQTDIAGNESENSSAQNFSMNIPLDAPTVTLNITGNFHSVPVDVSGIIDDADWFYSFDNVVFFQGDDADSNGESSFLLPPGNYEDGITIYVKQEIGEKGGNIAEETFEITVWETTDNSLTDNNNFYHLSTVPTDTIDGHGGYDRLSIDVDLLNQSEIQSALENIRGFERIETKNATLNLSNDIIENIMTDNDFNNVISFNSGTKLSFDNDTNLNTTSSNDYTIYTTTIDNVDYKFLVETA